MKAYKGFNKDMTCRGFQYEIGKTYETDKAELCSSGFHACENPLDCFCYYSPNESVYHEVELEDNGERNNDDTKVVGKKITVGAELSVPMLCKLHFEYVKSKTTNEKQGESCANLSAQDRSSLSAQDRSSLSAQDSSSLSAQDRSSLSAQDCSSLSAGKDSVLSCFNGKCKAGKGSIISIANREFIGGEYKITDFCSVIVDGEKIKADTWYKLENGEFVECE